MPTAALPAARARPVGEPDARTGMPASQQSGSRVPRLRQPPGGAEPDWQPIQQDGAAGSADAQPPVRTAAAAHDGSPSGTPRDASPVAVDAGLEAAAQQQSPAQQQPQPTPSYVSRLRRQPHQAVSPDGREMDDAVDSRPFLGSAPASVQASPGLSEMVYELEGPQDLQQMPAADAWQEHDGGSGYASYSSSPGARAGSRSGTLRSSGGTHGQSQHSLHQGRSDLVEYASLGSLQPGSASLGSGRQAGNARADSALPEYSGFSEEMRRAAYAAADALLAGEEASIGLDRARSGCAAGSLLRGPGEEVESSVSFRGGRSRSGTAMHASGRSMSATARAAERELDGSGVGAGRFGSGEQEWGALHGAPGGQDIDADSEHMTLDQLEARMQRLNGELAAGAAHDAADVSGSWDARMQQGSSGQQQQEHLRRDLPRGRDWFSDSAGRDGRACTDDVGMHGAGLDAARGAAFHALGSCLWRKSGSPAHQDGTRTAFPALAQAGDEGPQQGDGVQRAGAATLL